MTDFWDMRALTKRLYEHATQDMCDRFRLTHMELDVLLFLANNPQFDTATDIIEQKQLTKSHVSLSVSVLEKRGFLARAYRIGNRKTAHLRLLPAAEEIVASGRAAQAEFTRTLLAGLTEEESALIRRALDKIAHNIRAVL